VKRTIRYLILFAALFFLLNFIYKLKINKIECISQYGPCNNEIETSLETLKGSRLVGIRSKARKILEGNFLVESFAVQYKIPDVLEIRTSERKPAFSVVFSGSDLMALVDDDGYVLSFQDTTSLPVLVVNGRQYSKGEKVDGEILFSSKIMRGMHAYYEVEGIEIRDNSLYTHLTNGLKVIFPLEGDEEVLLGSFVAVFSKLNSQQDDFRIEKKIREVDLRFDNPVLR